MHTLSAYLRLYVYPSMQMYVCIHKGVWLQIGTDLYKVHIHSIMLPCISLLAARLCGALSHCSKKCTLYHNTYLVKLSEGKLKVVVFSGIVVLLSTWSYAVLHGVYSLPPIKGIHCEALMQLLLRRLQGPNLNMHTHAYPRPNQSGFHFRLAIRMYEQIRNGTLLFNVLTCAYAVCDPYHLKERRGALKQF